MDETTAPKPDAPRKGSYESFILREKIWDMVKYGMKAVDQFGWRDRVLADELKESMLRMDRLATTIAKRYYKKTTVQELDIELDHLRRMTRLASDRDFYDEKVPKRGRNGKVVRGEDGKVVTVQRQPPLDRKKYEVWNRLLYEIGCMIGGYIKSL